MINNNNNNNNSNNINDNNTNIVIIVIHNTQVLFTWSLVLATDCDGRFGAFEGCAKHPAPELMGRTGLGTAWDVTPDKNVVIYMGFI